MKKTKLIFTDWEDSRPKLSPDEARYWREFFKKTIKIGFELEYNLRKETGVCNGTSMVCPCTNPKKEETKCYTKCKIDPNKCKLIDKPEDCPGIYCVEFVLPCYTCPDIQHDCKTCVYYANPESDPSTVRQNIAKTYKAKKSLLAPKGVFEVGTDGSLSGDGGIELVTVGRRVDFDKFKQQLYELIDAASSGGAFVNERTSVHMHMLVGYYNLISRHNKVEASYVKRTGNDNGVLLTELEEPIPEIIVANFHQLLRRYQNALTWMSSSGSDMDRLTRWEKFRRSLLPFSAGGHRMTHVINKMARTINSSGKYAFVNYSNTKLTKQGDAARFHIEARFMDGNMSPTAIASFGVLLHALLIKAASFSTYGVMQIGTGEYKQMNTDIAKALLNNTGPYQGPRFSDTSSLAPYVPTLMEQSVELVNLLKSELMKQGNAYEVLISLAKRPCSIRLIEGQEWKTIENELSSLYRDVLTETDRKVLRAVDTSVLIECIDEAEWAAEVSEELEIPTEKVMGSIEKLSSANRIVWDKVSGTLVRV